MTAFANLMLCSIAVGMILCNILLMRIIRLLEKP
jgi:hypothetical protein